MRILVCVLILGAVGCAKGPTGSDGGDSSPTPQASVIPSQCGTPTTITHDFVHWNSETTKDYNCPGLFSKMSCHLYIGSSHSEALCETISALDPQTPPVDTSKVDPYTSGTHDFLIDGSEQQATVYDLGASTYFGGLRCFYFVDSATHTKEDIICTDDSF